MSSTRRFSVRKFLRFLVTTGAVVGCGMAFTAAAKRQAARTVRGIDLRITNSKAAGFLDAAELTDLLFTRRHLDPKTLSLSSSDIHRIERLAATNPFVARAEAYVDNQRILHVRVTQRVPAVRIFENDGSSYYLDGDLYPLPLSDHYSHYAPVVTGVPKLRDDSAGRAKRGEILGLVNRLMTDTFWSAQTAELHVNEAGEYEIVPTLGAHRVLLGDTSRLDQKLSGILQFYKGVLNRIGWEKYTLLDARYRGQIVASPSLPWKAPVDKALTNMNWVNTIVGRAPERRDSAAKTGSTTLPQTVASVPTVVTPKPAPRAASSPERAPAASQRRVPPATAPARPAAQPARSAAQQPKPAPAQQSGGAAPKYVLPETR